MLQQLKKRLSLGNSSLSDDNISREHTSHLAHFGEEVSQRSSNDVHDVRIEAISPSNASQISGSNHKKKIVPLESPDAANYPSVVVKKKLLRVPTAYPHEIHGDEDTPLKERKPLPVFQRRASRDNSEIFSHFPINAPSNTLTISPSKVSPSKDSPSTSVHKKLHRIPTAYPDGLLDPTRSKKPLPVFKSRSHTFDNTHDVYVDIVDNGDGSGPRLDYPPVPPSHTDVKAVTNQIINQKSTATSFGVLSPDTTENKRLERIPTGHPETMRRHANGSNSNSPQRPLPLFVKSNTVVDVVGNLSSTPEDSK